jgi:hypothetical protein
VEQLGAGSRAEGVQAVPEGLEVQVDRTLAPGGDEYGAGATDRGSVDRLRRLSDGSRSR